MKTGLHFLLAAKRCEMAELQQLAQTSALVRVTAQLVHGLQRERGLSNLLLAGEDDRWLNALDRQVTQNTVLQHATLQVFGSLDTDARVGQGARLFSRIAYAMQGLYALDALREQVRHRLWSAARATQAYIRLVNGLLAVVFEAADSAGDPDISRCLVALFNLMQGKEFAGQERACGAAAFGAGQIEAATQQQLLHLIDSQERCLQVFAEFASPRLVQTWQQDLPGRSGAELERLRRILCTARAEQPLAPGCSEAWFEACTARMDAMKTVEDQLADDLQALCQQRLQATRGEWSVLERLQADAPGGPRSGLRALSFFEEAASPHAAAPAQAPAAPPWGPVLDRSILDLVQAQAQRLQTIGQELDTVKASLHERKVIERAKGLLMAHRQLSEEVAYKTMRQMAMNQNKRLVEVAQAVLAMAEVLPLPRR